MEVFEFQEGDPTYQHTLSDGTVVPGGISIAQLQQQLGEKKGEYIGPSGETYHISLAAWERKDPEKTFLQMIFHTTPLFPADIDPELRYMSFPQHPIQPSSPTTVADKEDMSLSSTTIYYSQISTLHTTLCTCSPERPKYRTVYRAEDARPSHYTCL